MTHTGSPPAPPITHGAAMSAARRNMACNYSWKNRNLPQRSSLLQVALVETTKKRIQGQSGIDPRNWNSCFFAEWCFCCNPSEHPAKVDLFRVKFLFHGLEFSFQQLWSSCLARRPVWFFKSHRLRNGVTIKLPLATYLQGVPSSTLIQ